MTRCLRVYEGVFTPGLRAFQKCGKKPVLRFRMAIKTTVEQLEEVQAAITKVMAGQDVTIDGKRITRADLAALSAREDKLLARYKSEQGTGGPRVNRGIIERR